MGLLDIFKKPYTLGELMNIDQGRQQRSQYCNVQLSETFHELKKEGLLDKFRSRLLGQPSIPAYYIIFKFLVSSGPGHEHTVFIRVAPDFDLQNYTNSRVQIYCSCEDFKYRSAYMLERRGSLFSNNRIDLDLGPAKTDAPRRQGSLLCKHAYAAVNYFINNYQGIMKSV